MNRPDTGIDAVDQAPPWVLGAIAGALVAFIALVLLALAPSSPPGPAPGPLPEEQTYATPGVHGQLPAEATTSTTEDAPSSWSGAAGGGSSGHKSLSGGPRCPTEPTMTRLEAALQGIRWSDRVPGPCEKMQQ